jgi:hypothetical protein
VFPWSRDLWQRSLIVTRMAVSFEIEVVDGGCTALSSRSIDLKVR